MSRSEFDLLDMVGVSKKWVEPPLQTMIEAIPVARGIWPEVASAHQGLFSNTKKAGGVPAEVVLIRKDQGVLDARYDALLQGGYWLLTGLARITPDEARKVAYTSLRDKLYPDGIAGVQLSYHNEGNAALLLEKQLTDEERALLQEIPLPKEIALEPHMLSAVEEQIEKGKQIGSLEDEKKKRQEEAEALLTGPKAIEMRRNWLNAVRALETVLGLPSVDPSQRDAILKPLRDAEERYEKRPPRATSNPEEPPPNEPPTETD